MLETGDVRIVELEKFRYISFSATSNQPEIDALKKLDEWKTKSKFRETSKTRSFGFNNPMPKKDNPVYGYEIWLTIDDKDEINDKKIKEFGGGIYAVTTANADHPEIDIPLMWQNLHTFIQKSEYQMGNHQWLEEFIQPDEKSKEFALNLYFPVKK